LLGVVAGREFCPRCACSQSGAARWADPSSQAQRDSVPRKVGMMLLAFVFAAWGVERFGPGPWPHPGSSRPLGGVAMAFGHARSPGLHGRDDSREDLMNAVVIGTVSIVNGARVVGPASGWFSHRKKAWDWAWGCASFLNGLEFLSRYRQPHHDANARFIAAGFKPENPPGNMPSRASAMS